MGLVGVMAVVVVAACRNSAEPKNGYERRVATIVGIHVPTTFAASDTVLVTFSYLMAVCDTAPAVEVRTENYGMRFTATSAVSSGPCIMTLPTAHDVGYLIPPPHTATRMLFFSEPGGADSIRVLPIATGG